MLFGILCLNPVDNLDYFERTVGGHNFLYLFFDRRTDRVAVLLQPRVMIVVVDLFGRDAAALAQLVPELDVLPLERCNDLLYRRFFGEL